MSRSKVPCTEEEYARFKRMDFVKSNAKELDYYKYDVPISPAHKRYLEDQAGEQSARISYSERSLSKSSTKSSRSSGSDKSIPSRGKYSGRNEPRSVCISNTSAPRCPPKKFLRITMYSSESNEFKPLIALLDASYEKSHIRQEVVHRLKLRVNQTNTFSQSSRTVERNSSIGIGTVIHEFIFDGLSYPTEFHLIPQAPFDILLGRDVLYNKRVKFYSERGTNPKFVLTEEELNGSNLYRLRILDIKRLLTTAFNKS